MGKSVLENKKRIVILSFIFLCIILILFFRLFYIQVIKGKSLSKKAVQQRLTGISLGSNRGNFYDRNYIPFTNRETKRYIIAYPTLIYDKEKAIPIISEATCLTEDYVRQKIESNLDVIDFLYKNKESEYFDFINKGKLRGVIAIEKQERYGDRSLGCHIIGYISKSEKRGEMGLERSMDSYLYSSDEKSINAIVDSNKNIIPGLGFRKVDTKNIKDKLNIKLTIDYHKQRIIEDIMEENRLNGAIVVMDIKNGDILAMASYPHYNQNSVHDYINSNGGELVNKAVWAFDLGSVFKTVVAAAALESGQIDIKEKYLCKGIIDSGDSVIKCSTYENHKDKEIDIMEAFALSCNTCFVEIGMKIGEGLILNMAKEFGLGEKQCFEIAEEKSGYIPKAKEDGIGNISIGQGKIQVTPLQITTMMSTIANNGIRHFPRLVDEMIDGEHIVIKKIESSKPKRVISQDTALLLQKMLDKVVSEGTGKAANISSLGGSSGKTGTAETGIDYGRVEHGWFAGYIPSSEPRYAITVFVNNGKSGGMIAAPIFKQVGERMLSGE